MRIVACVKWGTMYGPEYVNILHAMVQRHLLDSFEFHCFTDDDAGLDPDIVVRPLPESLVGWWNKLCLFKSDAFPDGVRVLYLDLDTIITGSLFQISQFRGEFAILRDFYRPRGLGSGVMLWEAGRMNEIWDQFVADDCPELSGGDQAYIEIVAHRKWGHRIPRKHILQDLFPGTFVSYKAHCSGGDPDHARVVCFHGQPKPHNCGAQWVADHWCIGSQTARETSAA
jgi:hypothetical protein